jgi:hypothetical protein
MPISRNTLFRNPPGSRSTIDKINPRDKSATAGSIAAT